MILSFLKNNKKKILFGLIAIILIGAVFIITTNIVWGQGTSGGKPAEDQAKDVSVFFTIIATLAGTILSFVAGAVDWAISFGNDVLGLETVKEGWKIVLSFTNLGFILGIIIIAFATILRIESYALKQILWKLIVAALLVNFSLVIAGAFISVSNITSKYFLQSTTSSNLSAALGNAMQPQQFLMTKTVDEDVAFYDVAGKVKSAISSLFQSIASLFFIIIFEFLTILAFVTLFVMLLVRAIALIFLLILSPLIWLCWIFPSTQKYWSQWWSEFIKWNFFAPAVLFFVYLTILTAKGLKRIPSITGMSSNDAVKAFGDTVILDKGFFQHSTELFVILSLLYGGIYVANKFSIAGGSIGVSLASRAGKGATGWAGRKSWGGIKKGTGGLYNMAVDKMGLRNKSMEASKKAAESGMAGKLWYGLKARTLANLSAPAERAVGTYEADVSKLTMTQAMAQHSIAVGAKKVALNEYLTKNLSKIPPMNKKEQVPIYEDIIEDIYEEKEITERDEQGNIEFKKAKVKTSQKKVGEKQIGTKEKDVDQKSAWAIVNLNGAKVDNLYRRYNADPTGRDKRTGVSAEAADAFISGDTGKFEEAMNKFTMKLKKADMADIGKSWKGIFANPYGDMRKFAKLIAKAVGTENSQVVSSLLPHLGGADVVNNFSNIYKSELTEITKTGKTKEERDDAQETLDRFKKSIGNYKLFEGGWDKETSQGSTPPPKTT